MPKAKALIDHMEEVLRSIYRAIDEMGDRSPVDKVRIPFPVDGSSSEGELRERERER